jgi:hypothetical protein
MQKD